MIKKIKKLTAMQPPIHIAPHRRDIDAEIVPLLFKGNRKSIAIAIFIITLTAYLQSDNHHISQTLSWFAWIFSTYSIQTLISRAHSQKTFELTNRHWLYLFRAAAALCGLTWGLSSLFFFQPSDYLHQAFLTMSLAGICGGAIVIYALDRYASLSFLTFL